MIIPSFDADARLGKTESQGHDVLRLILVMQVVLGHAAMIALPDMGHLRQATSGMWPEILYRLLTRFGPQAAYLFVFLSGVMVAGNLFAGLRDSGTVPSFLSFMGRRSKRLVPVTLLSILLTALLDWFACGPLGLHEVYRNGLQSDLTQNYTPVDFLGSSLFLQPIFVDAFGSNGPLWTLGYIFQFYVLGWGLCRILQISRTGGSVALLLGVASMGFVRPEWAILFVGWLIGGMMRLVPFNWPALPPLLAATLLMILSNLLPALVSATLSCVVGGLFVAGLRGLHRPLGAFSASFLRQISNDSFVLYAVHFPVMMFVFAVFFGGIQLTGVQFAAFAASGLIAAITISWLVALLAAKAEHRALGKESRNV